MIVGLVKPTSGKITLDGKDITNDAMYKRAQKGMVIWHKKLLFSENCQ